MRDGETGLAPDGQTLVVAGDAGLLRGAERLDPGREVTAESRAAWLVRRAMHPALARSGCAA